MNQGGADKGKAGKPEIGAIVSILVKLLTLAPFHHDSGMEWVP
jgi:hypothetical protein